MATTESPIAGRDWNGIVTYPDPAVQVHDPRFARMRLGNAAVERLYTGARWAEGPVWFGDHDCLLFSDIPNNRILRFDAASGQVSEFRPALQQHQRQLPRRPRAAAVVRARHPPRHPHRA